MKLSCIITGCALRIKYETWFYWGDLHRFGDTYIFNAVLENGKALRLTDLSRFTRSKALTILDDEDYFERRGVFIVHITGAHFNSAAKAYLGS